MRVAGLAPVDGVRGLENIDVTKLVNGHMAYRAAMPRLLREVGWEVESDEFTEIEDPDPENHDKRQRELIRELDQARKEAEVKPEKRRFGFWKKGKLAEKKGWETYDDSMRKSSDDFGINSPESSNVLFDIEAIKAELASEQIEVKQLESTLPPMKVNLDESANKPPQSPHSSLRETKSYDASMDMHPKTVAASSQSSLANGHAPHQQENPFNQGYDEYDLSTEAVNLDRRSPGRSRLSFGSSIHSPSPQLSSHFHTNSPSRLPSPTREPPIPETSPHPGSPLRSSATMPSSTDANIAGLGIEHNAWADEDDDDFGREKEVKLTFG